jgi:predicted permease
MQQASADLARLIPIWMYSWPAAPGINPKAWEKWRITPTLRPLKQDVVGNLSDILWVVMGTIAIVMVIACANVANLLLVRAEARQQELTIRTALGAARGQIVRALLLESVLLGLLGGAIGMGFAYAGLHLLLSQGPANLPRLHEISMDARTLAFTLILSVVSGLLLGLLPALKYGGPPILAGLRAAGRTVSVSWERHHARNVLVVTQIAMSLVLLVSAGLMIRTFKAMRTIEPGFTHPEQLQTLRIFLPPSLAREPQQVTRRENDIVEKLAAIPGVASVGFGSEVPMEGLGQTVQVICPEGRVYPSGETPPLRVFKVVSPEFFQTLGTRLAAGREPTWTDVYGRRPVALISENLAREVWGAPSAALGKRFVEVPGTPWQEVIGVVQDIYENGVQEKAPEIVYLPAAMPTATFVIRTVRAGTKGFLDQVRQAVWSVDASLPLASVQTMQEIYDQSMARTSFTLVMLAIAGAMALLLGIVGIYGVISYAVSQRKREIGTRLALGAEPRAMRRMVVRQGLILAGIGAVLGLAAAGGLMQFLKSLLYGISTLDPLTYAAVPLVLFLAAGIASYVPARSAATVDPVQALREE